MKCQQKNIGYNTSGAFFPNKILFSPVCLSLVTITKPHLNHTYYRCTWAPVCAADREGILKQFFVEYICILLTMTSAVLKNCTSRCSRGRRGGDYSYI